MKRLDAGDDAQLAAAALAGFDFDGEHALESVKDAPDTDEGTN